MAEEENAQAYELRRLKDNAVESLEYALTHTNRLPNGREKSIALTHIETAILWLKK
jgi:hypothetical protein